MAIGANSSCNHHLLSLPPLIPAATFKRFPLLKVRGVQHVGRIRIQTYQGSCDAQSTRLAQRFRRHFEEAGG